MKARVRNTLVSGNGMWVGQIYDEKKKIWKDITMKCFTALGAKQQLKKYVKARGIPFEL